MRASALARERESSSVTPTLRTEAISRKAKPCYVSKTAGRKRQLIRAGQRTLRHAKHRDG